MHKLDSKPITLDCFEIDDYIADLKIGPEALGLTNESLVSAFIDYLEDLRIKYKETNDKRYWKELVRWLPEGWLQTRTWTCSYENLLSIYNQREFHKLSEWHQFCDFVKTLPYAKELIIENLKK